MSTKDLVELLQQKTTEDAYDYMQEGRPNGWLQESAGDEEQTNFAVYCVIWKFMPAARTTGVASFPLNRERFKYRVMEAFGMTKAAVDKHICTKDFLKKLKKLVAMLPELCTAAALYDDEGAWWTVVSSNGNAAGGGDQTDKVEKQRDVDLLEAELQRVKAELQRANARIQLLHDDTTTLGSAVASLELDNASLEEDNASLEEDNTSLVGDVIDLQVQQADMRIALEVSSRVELAVATTEFQEKISILQVALTKAKEQHQKGREAVGEAVEKLTKMQAFFALVEELQKNKKKGEREEDSKYQRKLNNLSTCCKELLQTQLELQRSKSELGLENNFLKNELDEADCQIVQLQSQVMAEIQEVGSGTQEVGSETRSYSK
jgi:chromosome segregation ATPase